MATVTKEKRQNGEHLEVTEARAVLASIRFELAAVEAEIARTPRGDIVEVRPLVKRKNALLEELRGTERELREKWREHEASRLIAQGYGDVLTAVEQYLEAVETMFAARNRAVQARAAFNAVFQEDRKGVPAESDFATNTAPPHLAVPPTTAVDLDDWMPRVLREFESWRETWGA